MKAPYKQTQHCWQTTPNIVENYMLCPLAHPVACTLLRVVGTYTVQKPVKLLAPCKWTQHCWPTTPNIVGSCWVPLHIALSVNCGVTKAYTQLCSGELRTLLKKAEGIIPWIWLFCTESKGHPSFSKESFWHKTHCFSQIWHNFVDTISFFIFFSLFAQLSTFIFNIKMKNK